IPSNLVKTIADHLIDKGEVTRGYLGIVIQPLTSDLAKSFDVDVGQGILVAEVSKDSPAEKAGLHAGDVIVGYRGKPVNDVGAFRNQVSLTAPGSKEEVAIVRKGDRKTLHVTIGKLTKDKLMAMGPEQSTSEIGLTVQTVTKDLAEQFNVKPGEGVIVTAVDPGSVAALAGIRPGTVILQVNRKPVKNAEAFRQAIKNTEDKRVLLLISVDGAQRFIVLTW
ncbi:MAG: PDZ domain-containing protein, partial [Exilibacterium sp.]